MNIEDYHHYCMSKPGVSDHLPFGPDVLVFKVFGKMFALTDINTFASINLKCDPDRAIGLREQYEGIVPGYHMNKVHWNTVTTDGSVPDQLLYELIDHSYALIYASLPAKVRAEAEGKN
ncbi:MAG: MmcQ/YjbR family DNA-binding protein [Flavobacteriales bacterium]|nr:MmcQ/YjbR family DNA-binding protein [Flavobacteriales bacterium]